MQDAKPAAPASESKSTAKAATPPALNEHESADDARSDGQVEDLDASEDAGVRFVAWPPKRQL